MQFLKKRSKRKKLYKITPLVREVCYWDQNRRGWIILTRMATEQATEQLIKRHARKEGA